MSGLIQRVALTVGLGLLAWVVDGCRPGPAPSGAVATVSAPRPAPALTGALTWLNSAEVNLAGLRGKTVLLHFFDYSSAACLPDLHQVAAWQQRYQEHGLVVIGVVSAVHDFALNPLQSLAAVRRLGLGYPVAVDSDFAIARRYGELAVPGMVLIDESGRLVWRRPAGRIDAAAEERQLRQLLGRPGRDLPPAGLERPAVRFVELGLGSRNNAVGNRPSGTTNNLPLYQWPATLVTNKIHVAGVWEQLDGLLRHAWDAESDLTDCLRLRYRGSQVYAVMKPEENFWKQVLVQQDGAWVPRALAGSDLLYDQQGRSYLKVDRAGLFHLIAGTAAREHELQLCTQGKGLSVYSISIGQ